MHTSLGDILLVGLLECLDKASEAVVCPARDFELSILLVCMDHGTQVRHLAFTIESIVTIHTWNIAFFKLRGTTQIRVSYV